ncbi:hypothetical protein [Gallaecimonas sp. GXIMD4217]|uniref:hypothetical protein n=1 Tax=Gallaecimonas sp. GXIMD4217 TaxID=3131927 RepID=UPI00311B3D2D
MIKRRRNIFKRKARAMRGHDIRRQIKWKRNHLRILARGRKFALAQLGDCPAAA